jgi:hypothetical protein
MVDRDEKPRELKTKILQRHLVIQRVILAISEWRKLRDQIASGGIEFLELTILVGDDLRQKRIEIYESG